MRRVLLDMDECIRHEAGLLHASVLDHDADAVCGILSCDILPDHRLDEKASQRVEIRIQKGITDNLHALLVYLDIPYRLKETYLGSILRFFNNDRISYCQRIRYKQRVHRHRERIRCHRQGIRLHHQRI